MPIFKTIVLSGQHRGFWSKKSSPGKLPTHRVYQSRPIDKLKRYLRHTGFAPRVGCMWLSRNLNRYRTVESISNPASAMDYSPTIYRNKKVKT